MWERWQLKEQARAGLRLGYWKALWASILVLISGASNNSRFSFGEEDIETFQLFYYDDFAIFLIFLSILLVFLWFIFLYRTFVGYPLEVGGRKFFTQLAHGNLELHHLSFGFKKNRYISIIKTMLLKGVFNFLWYLVFIIPGIVKAYAYEMVPYILADNPSIGAKRAVELSQQMTRGQKWRIFVLDLSFLGWYILGLFMLFIGTLFVLPYHYTTKGALYLILRQRALDDGLCTYEELQLEHPDLLLGDSDSDLSLDDSESDLPLDEEGIKE